ncbi:MAG: bifunctional diaminohydroxyphosphoribosylaminopyrimidine deaminase/5-amino-6-(5-phosphoribosylamino)uracil reductase RibD [Acidimicrobiales bacterium]
MATTDTERMRQAITAADAARRLVSPRPWVGAVVVPAGQPDHPGFAGATEGRSGPHAEIVALRAAGAAAAGSTLYTTLEPCSHHGRTGPCAEAVIDAGVARVMVGLVDPDPKVAGAGIAAMRAAGIDVEVGVGAAEVERQLAPYLVHRRTGRPYVVLKLAATLDGRTAAPDGSSQWITGTEARLDAHRLRADSDAVLAGAGTVRADDPALTARLPDGELPEGFSQPVRVILGRAPEGARAHPVLELGGTPAEILAELGARGVLQVLVEGGASVAHQFHASGLVDRYVIYLAPALFGGDDARGLFAGPGAPTIGDLWRGAIDSVTRLGTDLRIDLLPSSPVDPPPSPGA